MSYGFWLRGHPEREQLAEVLAELTGNEVDVGDDGEDDRNWGAPVSCTITPLAGDFDWHLDVYLSITITDPPSESDAAALLAQSLDTVVAYKAMPLPPSDFWLVGPDGVRTRARIYDEDSDDLPAVYRIDAVELD
ncbi:hypothetical protein KOI35_07945 [Actinoplanes bogorensis]|uniref:Uncharacterized protein n=1 Tax=Paractinoplanes bogorensis TaxID=1610840 RepID=A0ABS5YN91_9ACTN|nr:hypothetical protein [Actinoplanes bogorensis]MBU2663435.1 hypothetical protein [Actinoplanes bogorensis]